MVSLYFIVARNSREGFDMNENELYKELGVLTKEKERWEESMPYVASLLDHASEKIRAKALWLLGEMGLEYPQRGRDQSNGHGVMHK